MAKSIDLGKKRDSGFISISDVSSEGKTHYPHFYIDTDKTELLDIPDSGKCEIQYKVVHRQHTEDKRDGKKKRSCALTLEVLALSPPKGGGGASYGNGAKDSDKGARDAMDNYFKDK